MQNLLNESKEIFKGGVCDLFYKVYYYSDFRRKARVRKCNRFLAKKGVVVPGVPCVDRGNWERERDIARLLQNSVFWEVLGLIR